MDMWSFGCVLAELCTQVGHVLPGIDGGPERMTRIFLPGNDFVHQVPFLFSGSPITFPKE